MVLSLPGSSSVISLSTDYVITFEKMLKAGKYDEVSDEIRRRIFPFAGTIRSGTEAELRFFDRPVYFPELRSIFRKSSLRFATFLELLAFGIQYPEPQRQYQIMALGTLYQEQSYPTFLYKGMCYAPYLYGTAKKRGIDSFWVEEKFDAGWAFLGIRCRNAYELARSGI